MKRLFTTRVILRSIFLLIIAATVIMAASSLVSNRSRTEPTAVPMTDEDATLSMGGIQHMATRKGVNEWSVDSESASYYEEKGQVILTEITGRYFEPSGAVTTLKADQGALSLATRDLHATGHVTVVRGILTLESEALIYSKAKQTIVSETPVTIRSGDSTTRAQSMTLDLASNILTLKGPVKGRITSQTLKRRETLAP